VNIADRKNKTNEQLLRHFSAFDGQQKNWHNSLCEVKNGTQQLSVTTIVNYPVMHYKMASEIVGFSIQSFTNIYLLNF
jgi:hypothetical protein